MKRPTRITVFGVICLIVGGLSGLKNTTEAGLSLIGPAGLERMVVMMEEMNQPLSASQQRDIDVHINAMRNPVYRVGQAVESMASAVMALVLIIAGIGLLLGRAWSLRLTRWWSWYAIPAAGLSVVLSVRYLMPEMPDASTVGGVFSGAFMLVVLWVLPVLLLKQLPTPAVRAFLAARKAQRVGAVSMPTVNTQPASSQVPTRTSVPGTEPPSALSSSQPARPPSTRVADTTWRDDPWNDPSSS